MIIQPTSRIDTEEYLRKCIQAAVEHDTVKYSQQLEYFINMCDLPNPGKIVSDIAYELGGDEAGRIL